MTPWPQDPNGDMTPILEASLEDAKQRHPSGKAVIDMTIDPPTLTAADRCDSRCPAAAAYRMWKPTPAGHSEIDLCAHHWRENAAALVAQGFVVVCGGDPVELDGAPS
ncbi:hypothetical protein [Streptomyces sp. NPDC015131]|uniref:DUF7455 domain-containing protein n=1 Tax=Streptomyces sp. NPDC015131 TaxID=3364941 RepID=UPI0037000C48